MTAQINQTIAGTYPGGDTSRTLQLRSTSGTTCVIHSDVLVTSTGNVTQQAMLIRLYGI